MEQSEGPPEPVEPPTAPDDKSAATWGMLCHLSALSGYIGVPFGHIIGPLVFWLVKKDELPFVDEQGKEALNFQISLTIYGLGCLLLFLVLIGIPLLIGLLIFGLVMTIVASVKAGKGEHFRYPLCIRFLH
ncbi:MAG: DUF4870 domain-containing protein [Planctomycetota bacterium]